jgi:formate/nitrite transporter FocA (FNT family)
MPKSKIRKKVKEHHIAEAKVVTQTHHEPEESPKWLVPAMLAGFLIGLAWIVTYYVSATKYPVPSLHAWNMVVGFGFIAVGFSLATKWK